jgi:hypothetical protein
MAKKSKTPSVPLRTLTNFIEAFAQYLSGSKYLKCFRGQRDASWPIVAGIFRPEFKQLLENEKRAVRDLISVHPSVVHHTDGHLFKTARARVTFSRMSVALAVQMKGLGF